MNQRTALYRIYFSIDPGTYYAVSAKSARTAVLQAKRVQRALRITKRHTPPLKVTRIERLDRSGVRELKVKL